MYNRTYQFSPKSKYYSLVLVELPCQHDYANYYVLTLVGNRLFQCAYNHLLSSSRLKLWIYRSNSSSDIEFILWITLSWSRSSQIYSLIVYTSCFFMSRLSQTPRAGKDNPPRCRQQCDTSPFPRTGHRKSSHKLKPDMKIPWCILLSFKPPFYFVLYLPYGFFLTPMQQGLACHAVIQCRVVPSH